MLKYCLIPIVLLCMIGTSHAQGKTVRYEGGRKKPAIDSTLKGGMKQKADTLYVTNASGKIDTIINKTTIPSHDSIKVDTTFLKPSSLLSVKKEELSKDPARKRFNFFRDTISAGRVTLLSLVPGVGQAYNNQYWKIPVIYGAMGGFVAAGMASSNRYKNYKTEWERAVNFHLPQAQQDIARGKMENEGATRTLLYSAAAAVYFYQVADATFNYRGKTDHVRKATTLAAVFPGAGFIYTRTYWRLPIYYGGFITLATVIDYNNRLYVRYANAYNALTDNDPTTIPFDESISAQSAQLNRNFYRRNRDFGIIAIVGAYIFSIIDTHVIATLKNWDISPNLSMTIEPTVINNSIQRASVVQAGGGLSLKIRF